MPTPPPVRTRWTTSSPSACPTGEWDKKVLLQFEREMLGLYVSDHPLLGPRARRSARRPTPPIAGVQAEAGDEPRTVTLAGILSSVNRRVTKAGAPWAQATLEDLDGSIEVMFFPATYAQVALHDRRGRRRRHQGPDRCCARTR